MGSPGGCLPAGRPCPGRGAQALCMISSKGSSQASQQSLRKGRGRGRHIGTHPGKWPQRPLDSLATPRGQGRPSPPASVPSGSPAGAGQVAWAAGAAVYSLGAGPRAWQWHRIQATSLPRRLPPHQVIFVKGKSQALPFLSCPGRHSQLCSPGPSTPQLRRVPRRPTVSQPAPATVSAAQMIRAQAWGLERPGSERSPHGSQGCAHPGRGRATPTAPGAWGG